MQFREIISKEDNPNFIINSADTYQGDSQYGAFYQNILDCH
jgi:hypothetical protein